MSTFLDRVSITAVRGIFDSVELDLRSPLTLVYAPNGTGKTSIWSALQALLIGREGPNLQCAAAGAKPFQIEGDLSTKAGHFTARLTPNQSLSLRDLNGKTIFGSDALELIAPECDIAGLQTKGGVVSNRLAEHIRAARLLPSESLIHLIDDSQASVALRRQLFADLTGTSSLQIEQRELSTYTQRLGTQHKNTIDRTRQRQLDLDTQNAAVTQDLAEARSLIGDALTSLDMEVPSATDEESQLAAIRVELTNRRAAHQIRVRKLRELAALIASTALLPEAIQLVDNDLSNSGRELEGLKQSIVSLDEKIADNEKELAQCRRAIPKLTQIADTLSHRTGDLNATGTAASLTLSALRKIIGQENRNSVVSASGTIERLLSSAADWLGVDERIRAVTAEMATLAAGPATSRYELEEQVRQIDDRISEHARNQQEVERLHVALQSAAQQLLQRTPSSQCPCCHHEWGSSAELLSAVRQAREGLSFPREVTDAAALEIQRSQLKSRLDGLSTQERRTAELEPLLQRLRSIATRADSEFTALGLFRTSSIEALIARLEALKVQDAGLELIGQIGQLDTPPPEDLQLAELRARFGDEIATLQTQQTAKSRIKDDLTIERDRQRSLAEEMRNAQRANEQRLADLRALATKTSDLASELHLDSNNIRLAAGDMQKALDGEEALLSRLDELCNQISASLANRRAGQLAKGIAQEIGQLDQQRQTLEEELERARSLSDALQASERSVSTRFFETLSPAIASLFNHMQVNRVFSTITLKLAEESFSMRGTLKEEIELTPTHFSQGQRQDLALAMFLVRACTLGGSFFLDEPLLHLDDLNRTALLDCLRACVVGTRGTPHQVRLFVTTASWSVARHLIQKFATIDGVGGVPALTVYSLEGNVDSKVSAHRLPTNARPTLAVH